MGIGLGFGIGPLRVFVPLSQRRRRPRARRSAPAAPQPSTWTHEGCSIQHATPQEAEQHAVELLNMPVGTAAGWYPDPDNAARVRMWNGSQWTAFVRPAEAV